MAMRSLVSSRSGAIRAVALAIATLLVSVLVVAPATAVSTTGDISGHVTVTGGADALDGYVTVFDVNYRYLDSASVDGGGNYTISGLPAGDVFLRLSQFSNGIDGWYDGAADFRSATPVTVVAGSTTPRDVEIALSGQLAGDVTLANGSPALNGTANAYDADGQVVRSARVGVSGDYSIGGLPTGDYYVQFSQFDSGPTVYYGGATSRSDATAVSVTAGSTTTLNYQLPEAATLKVTLDTSDSNSATLPAPRMFAFSSSGDIPTGDILGRAEPDSAGGTTFTFSTLPDGDVYLLLSPSGDLNSRVVHYNGGVNSLGDATPVSVTAGATTSTTFVMHPVGTMTGTVTRTDDSLAANPDGERHVIVYSQEAASGKWLPLDALAGDGLPPVVGFTDSAGAFSIGNLLVGEYKVGFRDFFLNDAYFSPWDSSGVSDPVTFYGGTDLASASIVTVSAGATRSGVDGLLRPLAAPSVVTLSPSSGSTAGGTSVTLTGTHFTGATSVTFGGVAGTSLSVTHDGALTVKTPAHAAGVVDVVVTTPFGTSVAKTFTYVAPISPPASPDPASVSTVYRFWSPTNKSHFYTNSVAERDLILRTYPSSMWTYEGGTYNAFSSQQPGTVPLYRFWSAKFKGHFFTTSEAEKDLVIAIYDDATWLFEGIAYYVYPVEPAYTGTVTVARFWSQDNKHHFYTASAAERDHVIATYPAHEWAFEQNAFRVPSS